MVFNDHETDVGDIGHVPDRSLKTNTEQNEHLLDHDHDNGTENTDPQMGKWQQTKQLPFIFKGKFFKVISNDGANITAECTTCKHYIKSKRNVTSNLITHLKVKFNILL